jgi:predicted amidohydrolase YtcJ
MTFPSQAIEAQIEAVQAAGFDMHIHVDADGSARVVLDAYEKVLRRLGTRGGPRHVLAHNSMVDPADIGRYAQLGIIANCTPLWGTDYNGQYRAIYTTMLGVERVEERLLPYGDLVRSGAVVTYGSDIPGVDIPEIPPLIQIEALLTRTRPGYPDDEPLVARQRIGLHDALRGYTANGAYQLRLEHRTGSLTVGKAADLTVLGADLFRVGPEEIHAVPVLLTMMDGRITHDAR